MPLLDHFHPPLSEGRHWEGFQSKWANALVDHLNDSLLPPGYFAEPQIHLGVQVEIDAATFEGQPSVPLRKNGLTATLPTQTYLPPPADLRMPAGFSGTFEIQVMSTETGPSLVGAIELVSPANKDRPETRRIFALKCASYLCQGVSLIVVDIVTNRKANLHDEIVHLLPDAAGFTFPGGAFLYAAAYRPVRRDQADQVDVWLRPLAVEQTLPTLPLALSAELTVPIDLERTYLDACRKLRLIR